MLLSNETRFHLAHWQLLTPTSKAHLIFFLRKTEFLPSNLNTLLFPIEKTPYMNEEQKRVLDLLNQLMQLRTDNKLDPLKDIALFEKSQKQN